MNHQHIGLVWSEGLLSAQNPRDVRGLGFFLPKNNPRAASAAAVCWELWVLLAVVLDTVLNLGCPLHSNLVLFLLAKHEIEGGCEQSGTGSRLSSGDEWLVHRKPHCEVLKPLWDLWLEEFPSLKVSFKKNVLDGSGWHCHCRHVLGIELQTGGL